MLRVWWLECLDASQFETESLMVMFLWSMGFLIPVLFENEAAW